MSEIKDIHNSDLSGSHAHHNHHNHDTLTLHIKERKTRLVVYLTAITMVAEIIFGYYSRSMALLADGYHMSTHVFVFGLSWMVYFILRKDALSKHYKINEEKLLSLTGFISAILLLGVAIFMAVESVDRLYHPVEIIFGQAILVACIGLVVNIVSAWFLHHPHSHRDHTIHAAYLHVLADILTSVTAIVALIFGMYYKMYSLDAFSGIASSLIITRWSVLLILKAGKDLIL